ncbi:MAG TPA: D-glycero-beta-D-manno-heptose 1-phosphate adenylyltransferase [bacterium]|nr:D-glycero-beta-D-manno-heptose 1-phosphate adenylyltransferase [bacterium]
MKPREMLKGRYIAPEELTDFRKEADKIKKRVVFTVGSWDLLHIGQMRYLTEAKKKGDILVVGVSSNDAIKKVKGPTKPVLDEWIRAESLLFLKCVDYVTIIYTPSCKTTIELLKPDVFISVVEDYTKDYKSSKEYKAVNEYGGNFDFIDRQSLFLSTTQIAKRIIGTQLKEQLKDYLDGDRRPIKERAKK